MLYKKVMQDLRNRINSAEFSIGDAIPTEKQLVTEYSVSRITIRKAVEELVTQGMVEKRQGSGTIVISKDMTGDLFILKSTSEYTKEAKKTLKYQVVNFSLINPSPIIKANLKLLDDDKVYFIRRLKIIDGEPSIIEDSYMPAKLFPELNITALETSKYQYIDNETDYKIEGALQEFAAEMPDKEIVELLGLAKRMPILKLDSLANFTDGTLFEFTTTWFKPDTFSFKHYLKRQ